jgi:hypothetical protein
MKAARASWTAPRASLTALAAVAAAALACSGRPAATVVPEPFIAFERDLAGFREWEVVDLPRSNGEGMVHVAGRRREYLNRRPPAGAKTFPVGTMLVKEMLEGAAEGHKIFAMVKRGGGYNVDGASGWEWFELRERADGTTGIVWRGINAPAGEGYAGKKSGSCNACHHLATSNDSVESPVVRLIP